MTDDIQPETTADPHTPTIASHIRDDDDADLDVLDTLPERVTYDPPGREIPCPKLGHHLPEWTDGTREVLLAAIQNAPERYEVRAYIIADTGEAADIVTVPHEASVGGRPELTAPRGEPIPPLATAALYAVRIERNPDATGAWVQAVCDVVRVDHTRYIERVVEDDIMGTDSTDGAYPMYSAANYSVPTGDSEGDV